MSIKFFSGPCPSLAKICIIYCLTVGTSMYGMSRTSGEQTFQRVMMAGRRMMPHHSSLVQVPIVNSLSQHKQ